MDGHLTVNQVLRYGRFEPYTTHQFGDSMKRWWKSKIIWTQLIAFTLSAMSLYDALPKALEQGLSLAGMGLAVATIWFRFGTTTILANKE